MVASDHATQSVLIRHSLVNAATYNDELNSLVTLHEDHVLAISRLELSLKQRRFDFELLQTVRVSAGLCLCRDYFLGDHVLLFQNRSVYGPVQSVDRTELVLVNVRTRQKKVSCVPVSSLSQVMKFDQLLLIETKENEVYKVFDINPYEVFKL